MVEIADRQIRAELYCSRVGRELTEQNAQQSALAYAVVPDDAEPVAAHHAQRELIEQTCIAERVRNVARFDDLASGDVLGLVDANPRRARPLHPCRTDLAQLLERAHASFVARLASLDALANPDLLLGELLVEEGVVESSSIALLAFCSR